MIEDYFININELKFKYAEDEKLLLDIPSLKVKRSEHLFIEGPSGSGKTTLLNILTGIQRVNYGRVEVFNQNILEMSHAELDQLRADQMGVIFQLFNLIPYLTVLENIILSCSFSKMKNDRVLKSGNSLRFEAVRLCKALGLDNYDLLNKKAVNLSVGQQQRVAAARALIGAPKIIIADEPTSALDYASTQQFMQLLIAECNRCASTLIFVSHDIQLKSYFNNSILIN